MANHIRTKVLYELTTLDSAGHSLTVRDFPSLRAARAAFRSARIAGKCVAVVLERMREVYDTSYQPPEWVDTYRETVESRGNRSVLEKSGFPAPENAPRCLADVVTAAIHLSRKGTR